MEAHTRTSCRVLSDTDQIKLACADPDWSILSDTNPQMLTHVCLYRSNQAKGHYCRSAAAHTEQACGNASATEAACARAQSAPKRLLESWKAEDTLQCEQQLKQDAITDGHVAKR